MTLNIVSTRKMHTEYGNLSLAMKAIGYHIKFVDIEHDSQISEDVLDTDEEITCFTALQNTLKKGAVDHIPPFLAEDVAFYQKELARLGVQGIFIPPTTSSVLFACMIKHVDSGFQQVETADDKPWRVRDNVPALIKEASLVLAARSLSIPVFGSCHGAQLLWYMHGGELYSLPDITTLDDSQFNMTSGMLMNPSHVEKGVYSTTLKIAYQEEADYESDSEEEPKKDYNHNLLMVTDEKNWAQFNAKKHPNMHKGNQFFVPFDDPDEYEEEDLPKLKEGQFVARSFEYPGFTATQWHPHKDIDTKSALRYLGRFAKQCERYVIPCCEGEEKPSPSVKNTF